MSTIPLHHIPHLPVAKRFRPQYRLDSTSSEIYGAKNAQAVKHYPAYLTRAAFPKAKARNNIAIIDFDGIFTDGSFWLYNHKFNFLRGDYLHDSRMETLTPYVHARSHGDFALYNALSARNQAGLTEAAMRQNTLRFFDQVLMHPDFNKVPSAGEKFIASPFVNRGSIELLLGRLQQGGVNVVVSGSPKIAVEIFFQNLHRYAHTFFGMNLPTEPLVDFIIGGAPIFDGNGIATGHVEKPLPIGDGKRLLVQQLLNVWGIDANAISIFTDELKADQPLLSLGQATSHFAVNVVAEEVPIASQQGYTMIRTDGRRQDFRSPEELQFLHYYRKSVVSDLAVKSLREAVDEPVRDAAI